jgi:mono/diheme cytochrome c family protein
VDTGVQTGTADTAAAPTTPDTLGTPTTPDTVSTPGPIDTSVATPPITPPAEPGRDSPSTGAGQPTPPAGAGGKSSLKVSQLEYEGWRQYSVNCARCHGQDVLPNPVAANLLISVGPGGPMEDPARFFQVVSEGRPERGMPSFKDLLSPDQIKAIHAYVRGRAEGRIPPGRPERPQA